MAFGAVYVGTRKAVSTMSRKSLQYPIANNPRSTHLLDEKPGANVHEHLFPIRQFALDVQRAGQGD